MFSCSSRRALAAVSLYHYLVVMNVHILSFQFPVSTHVYTLDSTAYPKDAVECIYMRRQVQFVHFDNPRTRTPPRSRPLVLPIGATFYFLEAPLPFAAPPVGGALLGLPPLARAGVGTSLDAFVPVVLAVSALGYRGRAESVCLAPGSKGTHGTGTRISGIRRETSASALLLRHIE